MRLLIFILAIAISSFTQKESFNTLPGVDATAQPADPSKFTGSWTGQGQDNILISFNNGQYFIKLDADNSGQPVVKAKEKNGKLIVDPGIYYGYNGISTMTLVGKKLILKAGTHSYSYTRS
jgi:hypothetical protein